jgi:PAS domain S-box-containing protein
LECGNIKNDVMDSGGPGNPAMNYKSLSEKDVQPAIVREQVHLALRHLPTMQITSLIVALILAYAVRNIVSPVKIAAWAVMVFAIVMSRIIYYFRYLRVRNNAFDGTFWTKAYLFLAFVSGVIWGVSAFLIFPASIQAFLFLFVLVIASLSAATTVSHSSLQWGPAAWMVPALLFYAARCFMEGGEIERIISVLIIVYLFTLLSYSFNHHKIITRSIALRFENLKLLEDVRKSEESYRNLFNSMNDAIFLSDDAGRILAVNDGTAAMYGYPRDFFLGKTPEVFSSPQMNDKSAVVAAIQRAFAGEPQSIKFSGMRSDTTIFPQEMRLVQAIYGGRRVVLAVAQDISERKRAEAELLRTQKLEAIGVLAAGIAHDFNNLLQGIFGFLTVAKRKIDDREKALLMLDRAEKALKMSVNLSSQLLAFSKGGQPVVQQIAVSPIIENATRFALSGSRSNYRFVFTDDLWPVKADDGQISQLIQNIVLNAAQAMSEGGVVTVAASNVDMGSSPAGSVPGPGRWVKIAVQDTGVGIPEQNLQRIFEPYFTTKQTGSGLGLATSYSIAKSHGGSVEVSSIENAGSIFTIWLPAGKTTANIPAPPIIPSPLPKGRILVMDDEEVVRDSVGGLLETLGQDVELSADGESAIEKYRAAQAAGSPFTAVILDATVRGGMGGEETIRKLRDMDPSVIAVVSSGYSDDAIVSNYTAHGFKACLPKPFSIENLQAVLSAVMK